MASRAAFVAVSFVSVLCLVIVACEDDDVCGPSNCGVGGAFQCCFNGQCVDGTQVMHCGKSGMQCQPCTGMQCVLGQCQTGTPCGTSGEVCNPTTQCCDTSVTPNTCRNAGQTCGNGFVCQAGQCTGQSTTCTNCPQPPNCCVNGQCYYDGNPCPNNTGTCNKGICGGSCTNCNYPNCCDTGVNPNKCVDAGDKCSNNQFCSAGKCGVPCPCQSPSCCDPGTNTCVPMNQTCSNGQSCINGSCGAKTCTNCTVPPNCCDNGNCVPNGQTCTNSGGTCNNGTCGGVDCKTTCPGCCNASNQCLTDTSVPAQSNLLCGDGNAGSTCAPCQSGYTCSNNKCRKAWKVIALSVTLLTDYTNPDCVPKDDCPPEDQECCCWDKNDTTDCPADPYLKCTVSSSGQTNSTNHVNDPINRTANFSGQELFIVEQDYLAGGIICEVKDDDLFGIDQSVGSCNFSVPTSEFSNSSFIRTSDSCTPPNIISNAKLQFVKN